jgi:pseudaminic acid cytidylyltransferase
MTDALNANGRQDDLKVAIIPARGGSRRIPRKNIRLFHGRPLIAWPIAAALESRLFTRVVVSTDDPEIAAVAESCGAAVPFLRPPELADDFTPTAAVVDHALARLAEEREIYDYVCTIYPTAPLLESRYLIEGYERLKSSGAVYSFAAATTSFPIQRTFTITPEGRCRMFFPEHYQTRSQDLEPSYQDAGQFYWRNLARSSREPLFGRDSIPILLPRHLVQDIDTPEDWKMAELLFEVIKRGKDGPGRG